MSRKWFQFSEQGAGKKRLILTKYIYQIFGEIPVRIITFFVVLFVFIKAKEQRHASQKFFKILNKKHILISSFFQFLNYGNSLVDKLISCLGKINPNRFILPNEGIANGAFFITTHIGNVEILRSLFQLHKEYEPKRVNVFLQSNACEIFNNFLKSLELKLDIEVFSVEDISAETSILISERLKDGEIVFMAGDRVSAQNTNKTYEADFLARKIQLPIGTLKFAQIMNVPIYFIVCAKEGKFFKVYTEKFETEKTKRDEKLEDLKQAYVRFLEKYTLKYPYQFYNFYDFFATSRTDA